MCKKPKHIGILGAMPEEVSLALKNINLLKKNQFGDLTIYTGLWISKVSSNENFYLSIAWSGWGKVSASRAATRILSLDIPNIPKVTKIIFSGVAGGTNTKTNQWDVVVPSELVQHDMDASPIFKKFEIPCLKTTSMLTNGKLLKFATTTFKNIIKKDNSLPFGKVHNGLVATGDKFISDKKIMDNLNLEFPNLTAVEMEGAAVAQVAIQESVEWLIIRVISDNADSEAAECFEEFLKKYELYSWKLLNSLLEEWSKEIESSL